MKKLHEIKVSLGKITAGYKNKFMENKKLYPTK